MNTSAVNSPASLLQVSTPNAGKQDTASSSDTGSFNQVLSREMSGNANNADANKNVSNNNNASNNEAAKPVQKDGNSQDAASKEAAGKDQQTATTTSADAAKKGDDDKVSSGKDVKKDDKDGQDSAKVDAADAAGIAAFVAALTNAKATPAESAAAAATAPTTKVVLSAAEIKSKNDTIEIAGRIANPDTAADQDAVGKKADFVSALDKATANAGDSGKTAASAGKADADAAIATAQTVKVLDAAAAGTAQTAGAIAAAATAPAMQLRNDAQTVNSSSALLPPVGSNGWGDALGQKVVWMVQGAQQSATLTLNPPDLGPLQVTLNVTHNHATATFTAHQPEVRQALEASMPRLRDMLNDAGIQLGQSNVSAGSPNQQGAFGGQQQGNRASSGSPVGVIDAAVHVSHVPTPSGGSGMVDTFA